MKFGIERLKTMTIPIPNDEQVLLVPKSQIWAGQWQDVFLVLTDKGIHFRARRTHLINTESSDHSFGDNTFLAYNRIAGIQRGSGLWSKSFVITMVDNLSLRFYFKDIDQVGNILGQVIHFDQPRDLRPYDYSSHHPENGEYREVGFPQ